LLGSKYSLEVVLGSWSGLGRMHISFVSLHSAPLGKRICFALVQKEAVDVIAAGRVPNYIVVFILGDGSMVMNRLDITRLVEQPLSRGHKSYPSGSLGHFQAPGKSRCRETIGKSRSLQ